VGETECWLIFPSTTRGIRWNWTSPYAIYPGHSWGGKSQVVRRRQERLYVVLLITVAVSFWYARHIGDIGG
jgi:hypothetical protein